MANNNIEITQEQFKEYEVLRGQNRVAISLEEYMEYQELKKHKKEVSITEDVRTTCTDGKIYTGTSVWWKSDGAAWLKLAAKNRDLGEKFNVIYKSNKAFIEMLMKLNWRSFRKFQKDMKKEGVDQILHDWIKGYQI